MSPPPSLAPSVVEERSHAAALSALLAWLLGPQPLEAILAERHGDGVTPGDHDRERQFLGHVFDSLRDTTALGRRAARPYVARALGCQAEADKLGPEADLYAMLVDDLIQALGYACDAQEVGEGRRTEWRLRRYQHADRGPGAFGAFLSLAQGRDKLPETPHPELVGPPKRASAFRWHRWAREVCRRDYQSRAAKQIAPLLAQFADADGLCWPSQDQLQELTGMGRNGVRAGLQELRRTLALEVAEKASGHGRTKYVLLSAELEPLAVEEAFQARHDYGAS